MVRAEVCGSGGVDTVLAIGIKKLAKRKQDEGEDPVSAFSLVSGILHLRQATTHL